MALLSACSSAETPATNMSASGEAEAESTAASELSENEELPDSTSTPEGEAKLNESSVNCDLRSTEDGQETSIEFVNASDKTVAIYWLSYGAQEIFYGTLEPGQSNLQHTFVTHPWCIRELEGGRSVMSVVATEDSQKVDIRF